MRPCLLSLIPLLLVGGCQSGSRIEHIQHGLQTEQYGHADAIAERIKREVPARWNAPGSPHRIFAYDEGRMLDIRTTPENQQRIRDSFAIQPAIK